MKLKTLNDLIIKRKVLDDYIHLDELKQEAIKWLQHIDEFWEGDCKSAITFITTFFNIEPEDLK